MNPKTVIILILLLVLASVAYLLTGTSGQPLENHTANHSRDRVLLDESTFKSGLDRILIVPAGGARDSLELTRDAGRWRVTQPHNFPANTSAINELLGIVSGLQGYPATGGDIPTDTSNIYFEMNRELIVITLGQRLGAQRVELFVSDGDKSVRYNAQDTLHDDLQTFAPEAFYSKKLQAPLLIDIDRIVFITPGQRSLLTQDKENWYIGEGKDAERALTHDLDQYPGVAQLFELINSIELIELQDPHLTPTAFGLDSPIAAIKLVDTDNATDGPTLLEIKIGVPADPDDQTRFVSIGSASHPKPAVFTVATELALLLGQTAESFRDPRVMTIPRSLIGEMAIKNRHGHYTIRFMPNGIQFVTSGPDFTPDISPQQSEDGEMLAEALSTARAVDYVDQGFKGVRPIASVTMTARLDGKPQTLQVFPDTTDETVLVKTDNEPKLRRVERSSLKLLLEKDFLKSNP